MNASHLLRVLSVFAAIVCISTPLAAQDTEAQDKQATSKTQTKESKGASPTGTWEWDREGEQGTIHCVLKLKEEDGKVKGTFTNGMVDAKIEDGTYTDGKVELKFSVTVEDREYNVTLAGKVGKDEIKGTVTVNTEEGEQELDWNPKRTIPLESVAGTWRMFFTTPDGQEMRPEFVLKEKDGKAAVEFVDDDEIKVSNVKYENGNVKFKIALEYDGQPLEVQYDLELIGNTIDGILTFVFTESGEEGELDVEGSKIK